MFLCISFLFFCGSSNAMSEEFKFMIDTIGIPRYNVYGDEINEDIYNTYNVFVYSSPVNIVSQTSLQRFKHVPENGKWTENRGQYCGVGTRGEYYILGMDYSGNYIDNVFFPVDSIPETTPNKWNFVSVNEYEASWNDDSKYKYIEQLLYMKNTSLLFDSLDIVNNISDSYNLVDYGITASNIGFDKLRLNTCSTWKTMGIVTGKRINNRGQIRNVIFATKPIAINSNVEAILNCPESVVFNNNERTDKLVIDINFGAKAVNLNEYANKEQIKEIFSEIYINGECVDRISGSKTVNVDKNIKFTVPKYKINNTPNTYTLDVEVRSYMYTEFCVDGLMQDVINKNITINILVTDNVHEIENNQNIENLENNEVIIVPYKSFLVGVLKKVQNNMVISPLVQTNISKEANSVGIIEAGRSIALKIDFSSDIDKISELKIYIDNKEVNKNVIYQNGGVVIYEVEISKTEYNTLASWNYLRDKINNYFAVDFSQIGSRVTLPHVIKSTCVVDGVEHFIEKNIDTIDNFELNFNYQFKNDVLNKDECNKSISLQVWN